MTTQTDSLKFTTHQDGTVSIRLPKHTAQGRGPGLDDLAFACRRAADGFLVSQAKSADPRDAESYGQLAAQFERMAHAITAAL